MNTQGQRVYRLENVEIDTSRFTLMREGEERHLRQKTFQVLIYLLEQRERLVTKNELIEHVWSGTAVTDNALEQCLAEIRKVLGDDSRHPRFIKTVPRAGYRFIGKVEEVSADESAKSAPPASAGGSSQQTEDSPVADATSKPSVWFSKRALAIAAIILVVVTVTTIYLIPRRRQQGSLSDVTLPETAGKRSVAVMFFDNQSSSADLDWLREGLTDMLITGLSRSKNLTILSRQQVHTMLDRAGRQPSEKIPLDEVLDIAQKSKATIVITGSFARLGEQIRIDAQLHDARDGQLLAAERILLNQQEQILTQVDLLAIKLSSHLGGGDNAANSGLTSVMTSDLAAYRYYSLALERAQEMQNPEAIALLEKALALDPNFAMAYARIGYTYVMRWGRFDEGRPYLEKAFRLSERLTEKDKLDIPAWYAVANQDYSQAIRAYQEILARYPLDVEAYARLGGLLRGENRLPEAIEVFQQGLVIDSEAKDLFNGLGGAYSELGRHDEAIAMFQRYVHLAPQEANAHDSLGMGYQWAGRYDEAVREYERALALKADFYISIIHLGNTRYQQGRYREALEQFQRYIETSPTVEERGRGYEGIAQVQWSRGRLAAAERAARQALASNPANAYALFVVSLEKGDLTTAEKYREVLERLRTKSRGARGDLRTILYGQGRIELKKGRAAEAIEKFKEALSHRAPIWNIDAMEDCLANAYLQLGRHDEAIAEFGRILKLNPNYPLVHYHLAKAYEWKRQPDQARSEYERFLQIWKDADADVPEIINARKALSN